MHMHIVFAMTKVISLSQKAYETLRSMKNPENPSQTSFYELPVKRKKGPLWNLPDAGKATT